MSNTAEIATQLIELITNGSSVADAKNELGITQQKWFAISSKAHSIFLADAIRERDQDMIKPNVSATSNQDILKILQLNSTLADYALLLSTFPTMP